ncbi:MAG: hypothetical protein V2J12_05375, partial [Gammaproteobacteria bacterium]|nr:hypothetical protein [Gammaproteobacteria bacterium]
MIEQPTTSPLPPVRPSAVRYLKLGPGNRWFAGCRAQQRLELGHRDAAHELALNGQWSALEAHYVNELGKSRSKARDFVRELRDFYTLDAATLWVTFAEGYLWWAQADLPVAWLGGDGEAHGQRMRPTRGPWRCGNIHGEPLRQLELSSQLTQVAAYRQTLCRIKAADYLVRKINGETEPLVAQAQQAESALIAVTADLIAGLHWRDF